MEELASSLLNTLKRSSAPAETKLSLLNSLKSSIKHQRVPEAAQSATLECIRIAITTQTSATLVTAGFATLTHLIKRLVIQEQSDALFTQRANVLSLLFERLGDTKEVHRQAVSQVLCDLWHLKALEVEKGIREAIQGTNVRAKEAGMEWVTKMHSTQSLQFRNFVPPMVECLEEAEESVRESAKANILELFRDARDAAKADLKRQLLAFNVRRSITTFILTQLQIPVPGEISSTTSAQHMPRQETPAQDQTMAGTSSNDPNTSSTSESAPIEPLYVQSQRELEEFFVQMEPCFEHKESEDNWKARDFNTTKLRRLLKGNAPSDYHQVFITGVKGLLDGILKVVNSLRTTMASNGSHLLQELVKTLGPAMDPMVDMILQGLEKMSASTKHINSNNANITIDTLFARVSYHIRLVQHIWLAAQDKNVQPRVFASGWLKTILKRQTPSKAQFENSGGVDLADKAIRKCLADANPKVKENMRSTFWVFAQGWPQKAEAIMSTLDPKSKQLLEKDSANPNVPHVGSSFTASVGPVSGPNPRAAPTTGRSSLKDTIAAQKKAALAARRLPDRPNSAMSSFSPVRQTPHSALREASKPASSQPRLQPSNDPQTASKPPLTSFPSSSGSGLLSSAPMRRPRRPELLRPATADIYATRGSNRAETPPRNPTAPAENPAKSAVNSISSGQAVADRMEKIEGQVRSGELNATRTVQSPKISPSRSLQQTPLVPNTVRIVARPPSVARLKTASPTPSPSDDNFTIIIPKGDMKQVPSPKSRCEYSRGPQTRLSLPTMTEEDNFTLVMPRHPRLETLDTTKAHQDLLSTVVEGQPIMFSSEQNTKQEHHMAVVDLTAAGPVQGLSEHNAFPHLQSSSDGCLIIFEDPAAENIVIPVAQIEGARAALEDVHHNSQRPQLQLDNVVLSDSMFGNVLDEATSSLAKKLSTEEKPTVARHVSVVNVSSEESRTGTRDIISFERLLEDVRGDDKLSEEMCGRISQTLLRLLSPSRDDQMREGVLSRESRSQVLGCIRATVATLPRSSRSEGLYGEILGGMIIASRVWPTATCMSDEYEQTMNSIIANLGNSAESCLNDLLNLDWIRPTNGVTHCRMMTTALKLIGKLALSIHARGMLWSEVQRTQFSALALQSLKDSDSEVRRAGVRLCLDLHVCFGQEHNIEFCKFLHKAGDAQLGAVAYYLAREGRSLLFNTR